MSAQDVRPKATRSPNQAKTLAVSFLLIILFGAGLLMLPIAHEPGVIITPLQAVFSATSATCVTGLMVVDPAAAYSLFGEIVLLCLIQLGGLGFMLFATSVLVLAGRRVSLRSRVLLHDTMSLPGLSGAVRNTLRFVLIAFGVEILGAMLLSIHFIPRLGAARGVYFAVFHAISAYCNAGIDLFSTAGSLTTFVDDPLVLLTFVGLIVLGGLGFAVLADVLDKGRRPRRFALHTKIVLVTTVFLLVSGTLFFMLAEWNNPMTLGAGRGLGDKLLNAFFQSVTTRTAGFYSVSQSGLTDASKMVTTLLMFIGASPASTGGGVKTSTLFVLLAIIRSVLAGRDEVNAFGKRLPLVLIRTALSIFLLYLALLFGGSVLMGLLEQPRGFSMIDLVFEEVSALGTVGLTAANTPTLTRPSQIWLIVLMYFGRVGPLTMMLSITRRHAGYKTGVRYPEEEIIVG
ncbi:MAG: potassium transporter TrkG [Eubacteriales bacterium]|jgi:trk system potassium uptake protein TrkH|nr:potassium transporter TrkG [Eubacteriales bacterium]MDD4134828.1 potassium transporter TrkG [Eubacteriales bacterium]NLO14235.1 Trk family potassium uptake protein [Clostridiales bacterium]